MQKATVLSARSVGFSVKKRRFLKLFRVLLESKKHITLIISVFHIMTKISVFRDLRTTCRQISTVFAVRTCFLLILFVVFVNSRKDDRKTTERCWQRKDTPANMLLWRQ